MAHKADSKKTETNHKHVRHAGKKECQVKGCKNEYRAKGYCGTHYKMWKDGLFGKSRYESCSKEACNKVAAREGMCDAHWKEKRSKAPTEAPSAPAAAPAAPAAT